MAQQVLKEIFANVSSSTDGGALVSAMTYAQARKAALTYFGVRGWTVKDALKVPHATSPNGKVRYWFKAQAMLVSFGDRHSFGDARSTFIDIRQPGALQMLIERSF